MIKEREALKLALEALKGGLWDYGPEQDEHDRCDEIIAICEEALAQPEQDWSMLEAMQGSLREHMARIKELESQLAQPEQEPIAWLSKGGKGIWFHEPDASLNATPLYTTTLQRKPLTDEEKDRLANAWFSKDGDTDVAHRKAIALIEEVEAAYGIKGLV